MAVPTLAGSSKITISLASVAAIVVGLWQFHQWLGRHLDDQFFSESQAAELTEQVKMAADAAQKAATATQQIATVLSDHIRGEELKEAKAKLSVLTEQLSGTQLWESEHGTNEISKARKRDLQDQIDRLHDYLQCRDAGRSNCQ